MKHGSKKDMCTGVQKRNLASKYCSKPKYNTGLKNNTKLRPQSK